MRLLTNSVNLLSDEDLLVCKLFVFRMSLSPFSLPELLDELLSKAVQSMEIYT
jgi:hypothetical protein